MNKFFNAFIVMTASSMFSLSILAQDVEEIVVTSALIDSTEITNPLYVINGDEIVNDATTSLGDAIDGYLGISMADYGAAVGQPIIRGMSGPRVKILKNGMVNRDVSGLGVDHLNDVDLNDIQQIEIVKGPSSLLYANGTIGGIINVVDDCIAAMNFEIPEVKIGYETQSVNDGSSEFVNLKKNINGFNINFGYKNSEFGNYDIPNGAILHEEEHEDEHGDEHEEDLGYVNNSDFAVEATKFGISKVGDWGYVGLSVDSLKSVYGIPFHGDEHEDEHSDEHDDDHGNEHGDEEEHEEERIFSTTDSESFTIKGSYNVNGGLVKKIDYTYRDSDYTLTEAHAEEEGHEEHEDEEEHEEHAPTNFINNATEYGAIFDMSNDVMTQKFSFNYVEENTSIFGEEVFMNPANNEVLTLGYFVGRDFDPFHLDFGMRLDQIDRSGTVTDEDHGDIDSYNVNENTNSFAISIGRDLTDSLDINLGFSSVERMPSVIELFMNGPHLATGRFEVGDPTLSSETSNNIDISFNFDNGEYFGYASFYINDVDNYITLMDEDDDHEMHGDEHHEDEDEHHEDEDEHHEDEDDHGHGNLIHANYIQEDAEFDGYEIEFGRTIDLGKGQLKLSFGRDVVNAKFSDGHNVPRINPSRNVYSLSYAQEDVVFKLDLKDVAKQKDFGEGESATDAYQMLDTRVTKTFNLNGSNNLKVTLFGKNLLDEVARNHSSFVKNEVPLPGRNYGIKFNLTY
ncbi:TonB-dependent receptor [Gammaproteobacteria bacterium]|nr:TonB-dependent receptor [Gammaproteobacteria bacterium]MDC1015267.1 TonB-dependent receptor [Gammaproteobacteria bacterium]